MRDLGAPLPIELHSRTFLGRYETGVMNQNRSLALLENPYRLQTKNPRWKRQSTSRVSMPQRFQLPSLGLERYGFPLGRTTMPAWRNGRRDRLKICCPEGCGGSSPSAGTTLKNREKSRFFRIQVSSWAESNNESNNLSADVRRRPSRSRRPGIQVGRYRSVLETTRGSRSSQPTRLLG